MACSNNNNDDKIQELEKKLNEQEREMLLDKQNRLENELSEKNNEIESLKNNNNSTVVKQEFHALGYGAYPEASHHILTSRELRKYSSYDLRIMRNEVFARYGYIFKSSDLREYFNAQEWYRPLYNNVNHRLTHIEKVNVEKIKEYE